MTAQKQPAVVPRQLPLPIRLSDAATLSNFCCAAGESHHQPVEAIGDFASQRLIYLWGSAGSGVSHLLQAACHQAQESGQQSQYLPLAELLPFDPEQLLENLEQFDLVCIDGAHLLSGHPHWQRVMFDFFNRIRDADRRLMVGANCSPRELPLGLADLKSRLGWGLVFQLPALTDEEKVAVLQFRAGRRGIQFAAEPASFLIRRSARDMTALMARLDQLEAAAIARRRTLTIPFIKETFGW